MGWKFEISRESQLPGPPEHVWDAVATGPGNLGWLFPIEIEPRVGGTVSRGPSTVLAYDPPGLFSCRHDNAEGFSSTLEYRIEPGDGSTVLRTSICWAHSTVWDEDWETRADAAEKHTDFHHHTLKQYLTYFRAAPATFVQVEPSVPTSDATAFTRLRRGLGGSTDLTEGDTVRLALPGIDPLDGVVDYSSAHFLGLRTSDGLYRFLGRNAWGWPISLNIHLFADNVDQHEIEQSWRAWLDKVLG